MDSLALNVLHLAAAGAGAWIVTRPLANRALFWAKALACAGAMALFLLKVSAPGAVFEDFTDAYWAAGHAVLAGPQALRPLFEQGVSGFVNLPLIAYLFVPFGVLPEAVAQWAFFALGGASVLWAWRLLAQRFAWDERASALALFAMAAFGPLIYSIREGNTSHMLLALLVWGVALATARRDVAAGLVFAFCALIKPPLLLLGFYAALRGRWTIAFSGAGLCVAAALLSLLVFGWDMHALWIAKFAEYGAEPMPGYNAQSFASALSRLSLGYQSLNDWTPHPLPPLLQMLSRVLSLATFAAGLWAMLRARRGAAPESYGVDLVLAFVCIAATVSWSHYFVWLVPAFAYLAHRLRDGPPKARWALGAALLFAAPGEFHGALMQAGAFEPLTWALSSHLLIGGVIVFALLCVYPPPRVAPAAPIGEGARSG